MLGNIRGEKIARLRQLNMDLESLSLRGQITSDDGFASRGKATATIEFYRQVREHAIALYSVFREKLRPPCCPCPTAHGAGLLLDTRKTGEEPRTESGMRFRTVVSVQDAPAKASWREVDIEPIIEDDEIDALGGVVAAGSSPSLNKELPLHDSELLIIPGLHNPR